MSDREAYSRVYWSIHGDTKFEGMTLAVKGAWLDLLVIADQAWPASARLPLGIPKATVTDLASRDLIVLGIDHLYRIKGLDGERGRRSGAARKGAAARWSAVPSQSERSPDADANGMQTQSERTANAVQTQSERTANGMPRRDETRRERERATTKTRVSVPKNGAGMPDVRLTADQLAAWRTFGLEWEEFKRAWLRRGFLWPPAGEPDDDDTSQRGLLWQVLDARPSELAEWVRLAPGQTTRQVIAYVLDRWHEVRVAVDPDEPDAPSAPAERKQATERLGDILRRLPLGEASS